MKKLVVFLLLFFSFDLVNACTIEIPLLRREFRQAQNVFTGEAVSISDPPKNLASAKEKQIFGVIVFKIYKSWKGKKGGEISLFSNVGSSLCGNDFDSFKKGEKYLIFAERDYVNFLSATKFSSAKDKLNRLDDFGFRLWTKIYPF